MSHKKLLFEMYIFMVFMTMLYLLWCQHFVVIVHDRLELVIVYFLK